jgi:hypothetical protein
MGSLEVLNDLKEELTKIVKPENIIGDPAILEENLFNILDHRCNNPCH